MRDVDISPDGTYAVISTTGAYRANLACDTQSRFEVHPERDDLADVGQLHGRRHHVRRRDRERRGLRRWPHALGQQPVRRGRRRARARCRARACTRSIPSPGLPFSWNPGRERGVGLFDYFVTDAGVWAGSDTDRWANELRQRLAFFPFAGGTLVPANNVGSLPADIVLGGRTAGTLGTDPSVLHRVNAGGPALDLGRRRPRLDGRQQPELAAPQHGSTAASVLDRRAPVRRDGAAERLRPRARRGCSRPSATTPPAATRCSGTSRSPAGTQIQVRLYFANRSTSTDDLGERVFDVDLDGATVLDDLDLSGSVGHNIATMRSFDITSDGSVTVLFRHGAANNPMINGIEIVRTDVSTTGTFGTQDEVQRRFYNGTSAVNPAVLPGHAGVAQRARRVHGRTAASSACSSTGRCRSARSTARPSGRHSRRPPTPTTSSAKRRTSRACSSIRPRAASTTRSSTTRTCTGARSCPRAG